MYYADKNGSSENRKLSKKRKERVLIDNTPVEEILEILCCPECSAELKEENDALLCTGCGRRFQVESGIPLLYPEDLDREHLREEKKLGKEMITPSADRKVSVSGKEWERSKQEFWNYVQVQASSMEKGIFLNIGCGVDLGYLRLGRPGIILAGLDIVPQLIDHLREKGMDFGVAGSVHRLPVRENSFDALCCTDLVHHEWERAEMILARFHSILKPGGMLFLEDINAWGLGQFYKSILLPKNIHGTLRKLYHRVRGTENPPAEYEFPTSVFRIRKMMQELGFRDITAVPLESCPNSGRVFRRFYRLASRLPRVAEYHNFHYMLTARK
ncbi:MAG: methyltransferase domain-containing protein [Candidatus Latescibacteria bacterium]|nr:methyltransferase domain-containing protein [bacterium]MBD3424936.1 methyltransferase domain-containing protein [Candidatus Latescibacterota bacterium]